MAERTSKGLWEPILEQGIENTHFFNGRLLTAFDLQKEQQANCLHHRQLGQVIGTGVAYGLQVGLVDDGSGGNPPVVAVNAGLAVNPAGKVIALPVKVEVQLERASDAPTESGPFEVCLPPQNGDTSPGKGAYILAIRPASGYRELAPRRSFGENGKVDGCGSRYAVEGVQFHLEELPVSALTGLSQDTRDELDDLIQEIDELRFRVDSVAIAERRAKLSRLRNWLAHVCLGTEEVAGFVRDPFARANGLSPYMTYGAVDALRKAETLTNCDVPLALVYWTTGKMHFVDMWSVRRRLVCQAPSAAWPLPTSDRRLVEGEAAFLQFQEQVAKMTRYNVSSSQLEAVEATGYFRFLPAAGIIPLTGVGSAKGFDYLQFFSKLTVRNPVYIEGVKVQPLIHLSFSYAPNDLENKELVWLYIVRENMESIRNASSNPPQPYMIFTNGHVPYQDDAQYDLARWDYSNYGLGVAGRFG